MCTLIALEQLLGAGAPVIERWLAHYQGVVLRDAIAERLTEGASALACSAFAAGSVTALAADLNEATGLSRSLAAAIADSSPIPSLRPRTERPSHIPERHGSPANARWRAGTAPGSDRLPRRARRGRHPSRPGTAPHHDPERPGRRLAGQSRGHQRTTRPEAIWKEQAPHSLTILRTRIPKAISAATLAEGNRPVYRLIHALVAKQHLLDCTGSGEMADRLKSAFFAYPGSPSDLTGPIASATSLLKAAEPKFKLQIWPHMDIFGSYIPDKVRSSIEAAEVFACDITVSNANVYYEVGYAIGLGKRVAPLLNSSFAGAASELQKDGMFDNIGYKTYENSQQLADLITKDPSSVLLDLYSKSQNTTQPLFLLDTFRKTDFRNAIVSAIKSSKVFYRSFDPIETPRFTTTSMIAEISSSSGVIIPFLASHIDDAARHNLRASFLSGLSQGMGKQSLLLKLHQEAAPMPADYRDLAASVKNEGDITALVTEFAQAAILATQNVTTTRASKQKTALQRLTLGASAAENEFRTLEQYFVETSEFVRTLRGEVSIVAGRKGSGKTAIFFRIRDTFRSRKQGQITDLKPESHQLSLFREELLKVVDAGAFDHTLAAFWYFLILSELLLTIKREAEFRSKFEYRAYGKVSEIGAVLEKYEINESGDFTSRINRLGAYILQEVESIKARREKLSPERLTNIVFRGGLTEMKSLLIVHTSNREELVLLFDNIDKGWPTNGVHQFDVRLVRLLVETLDKVRRDLAGQDRDFMSVVFLRNDIYELLVEATPDRGKAGQVRIDWTDRAKLKQVIYQRLKTSPMVEDGSFEQIWSRYFVSSINGRDTFEYFVDHCLMRPRFLINIIENAIANGINRGHTVATEEDCVDAVRQHSLYLVDDFGYEIRDVSGINADILYSLVGVDKLLTKTEVIQKFHDFGIAETESESAFRLMLWYGVLGVINARSVEMYIYDYEYNMRRLEAEIRNASDNALFVVNPALHVALIS